MGTHIQLENYSFPYLHRYTEHLDKSAKLVETGIQTMEEPEMAIFLQVKDTDTFQM